MASLDLSAVIVPGVVRKDTMANATEVRLVTMPTGMLGVKGGGLDVSVYPVGTALYWVSPEQTQPAEGAVYDAVSEVAIGYCPADQWTTIPWSPQYGSPASVALTSRDASQVYYVAVNPARVPE